MCVCVCVCVCKCVIHGLLLRDLSDKIKQKFFQAKSVLLHAISVLFNLSCRDFYTGLLNNWTHHPWLANVVESPWPTYWLEANSPFSIKVTKGLLPCEQTTWHSCWVVRIIFWTLSINGVILPGLNSQHQRSHSARFELSASVLPAL